MIKMNSMKKKLLALGLTAVMALGMGSMTQAVDVDVPNVVVDQTSVTITKEYNLDGEGSSPAETFELTCTASKVTDGDATAAPALVSISGVSYAKGAAGSSAKTGTFTVTLPTYTQNGVYEYTLQETDGKTAGVTYRADSMKLVVTVVNDDNGLARIAAVHTEKSGTKTDSFAENTYTANSLSVSKEVTGNLGDKNKEFSFTVTFTAPEGKTWNKDITMATGGGETDLQWNGNTATFTLSDGDTATFENVPAGVTYTVVEDDYKADGYTTTYDGKETGTMGAEAIKTTVTNDKEKDVDTGIYLDNLPYILMLAVVVIAAAAFVISRKRRVEL